MKFSEAAGQKVNVRTAAVFPYNGNEKNEKEIEKTIPLKIAS